MKYFSRTIQNILVLLRVVIGWLFFYAGITKVLDPSWSAAGYLQNAHTFPEFFAWLASPGILPVTNFLNQWGLTLIGLALIFGLGVRLASSLGAVMMLLYWLPALNFPLAGEHSYIVDDHIIYIVVFVLLAAVRAGRMAGFDGVLGEKSEWYGRYIG